jgi:hypothetical protein
MIMDKEQLRDLITRVLKEIDLYSDDAVELLMLTAATESNLGKYIRQKGGGPALGIFQMEKSTEQDIWFNYLRHRPEIRLAVLRLFPLGGVVDLEDLEFNLGYQIAMARVHYLRVPKKLPDSNEPEYMAIYWKKYYNTYLGKGTVEKATEKYKRYCL